MPRVVWVPPPQHPHNTLFIIGENMKRTKHTIPRGRSEEAWAYSRELRSNYLLSLGVSKPPESILYYNRNEKAADLLIAGKRRYTSGSFKNSKPIHRVFETSGIRMGHKVLSRFPQNVGKIILRFYCPEGGIVYDPFAGHNSRMQLVHECARPYIGVDICKEFMRANRRIRRTLLNDHLSLVSDEKCMIKLIEGSSHDVDLPNDYADFTITSPPYWDIEDYGPECEQLGKLGTYGQFILRLRSHVCENVRILKPGTYCCWFINDFTKNRKYYTYHSDIIDLFRSAGLEVDAVYIIDLGIAGTATYIQRQISNRRFSKRHEYCIVGRKPGNNRLIEKHFEAFGRLHNEA